MTAEQSVKKTTSAFCEHCVAGLRTLAAAGRMSVRLVAFVVTVLVCVLVALGYRVLDCIFRRELERAPVARLMLSLVGRAIGLRIQVDGQPVRGPALLVSNHVSWADIIVLGGHTPLRFLSKQEVARWPVIGWLAQQAGTLFIRRRAGQAGQVVEQIAGTLEEGHTVLVFPEGTTSPGDRVLPFHGKLLHAARHAYVPVQPVTLAYLRQGHADRYAPFVGDDAFLSHLVRVLMQPALRVNVIFHPAIEARYQQAVTMVARQCHDDVRQGLTQLLDEEARLRDRPSGRLTASQPVSE